MVQTLRQWPCKPLCSISKAKASSITLWVAMWSQGHLVCNRASKRITLRWSQIQWTCWLGNPTQFNSGVWRLQMLLLCLLGRPSKPVHSRLCLEIVSHFLKINCFVFWVFLSFYFGFWWFVQKGYGFCSAVSHLSMCFFPGLASPILVDREVHCSCEATLLPSLWFGTCKGSLWAFDLETSRLGAVFVTLTTRSCCWGGLITGHCAMCFMILAVWCTRTWVVNLLISKDICSHLVAAKGHLENIVCGFVVFVQVFENSWSFNLKLCLMFCN